MYRWVLRGKDRWLRGIVWLHPMCFLLDCAPKCMQVHDQMHLHPACSFQVDHHLLVGHHTVFAHTLRIPCVHLDAREHSRP